MKLKIIVSATNFHKFNLNELTLFHLFIISSNGEVNFCYYRYSH